MESYYSVFISEDDAVNQNKTIVGRNCVCCLTENVALINLTTCKHTSFYGNICKFKFLHQNGQVCVICHNMLQKIDAFQKQVEEASALLIDKAKTMKVNKLHNLQHSHLVNTDSTEPYVDTEHEVKTEIELEINPDLHTEVKIDHDDSDYEPLPIKKKNKKEPVEKCKAKTLKVKKLHNLQHSSLVNTYSTELYVDIEPEVKTEIELEINPDLHTEMKIEHDHSGDEPLPVKKKKKSVPVDKYEGKIQVIRLTVEELTQEREALAKQTKYVSLPYKCEYCITGFDHEITWKTHMEQRHTMSKGSFQCNICKSVLNSKSSYTEHTKRHLRRLECMDCGIWYKCLQFAIQHYDEKHLPAGSSLQKGYTCQECGFTTTVHRKYRYHMDKHKQKQECTICGNIFVNTNSLKCHMYTVHKQSSRVYPCDACNKTYRAKSGLTAHLRSVHATAPSPRAYCAPCRTYFTTQNALQAHLNTHSRHSEKRFICDECGAKFVKKSTLQMHINWEHLKINTHSCQHCNKIFKSASCLRRHVNFVHEKQRPPRDKICHFCGQGFTTQTILQSHLRTHTGERPHQCQHCRANFAHSGALYTHMKLKHAGLVK